jgi:hypothetical protein
MTPECPVPAGSRVRTTQDDQPVEGWVTDAVYDPEAGGWTVTVQLDDTHALIACRSDQCQRIQTMRERYMEFDENTEITEEHRVDQRHLQGVWDGDAGSVWEYRYLWLLDYRLGALNSNRDAASEEFSDDNMLIVCEPKPFQCLAQAEAWGWKREELTFFADGSCTPSAPETADFSDPFQDPRE